MRRAALFVLLALAACSAPSTATASPTPSASAALSPSPVASQGNARRSPSPSARRSPSPSARRSPSPSPAVSPSPAAGVLSCRLPVASGDAPVGGSATSGHAGAGGLITLPGGAFAADPQSLGAYDGQLSRWVPVRYAELSADGSHYAFPEYGTGTGVVHVTEVAGGSDQAFNVPTPHGVAAFQAGGVYLNRIVPNSDAPPSGLGVLDPAGGSFRQVSADLHSWTVVGGDAAWAVDLDPSDPNPPPRTGPGPAPGDRVIRLDLQTGAVSNYLTIFGSSLLVLGLDSAGLPIIAIQTPTSYAILVTASRTLIFSGPPIGSTAGAANPYGPALSDGHGTWFPSLSGVVWLWQPDTATARQVASTGLAGVQIAGPCA